MSKDILYRVPKEEHYRMLEHAKGLLKVKLQAKWDICKIALKLCYFADKKGYIPKGAYTITSFAEDINMSRKTLSCWILDYEMVYLKLDVDTSKFTHSDHIRFNGELSKVRKKLFNFNRMKRYDDKGPSKEQVIQEYKNVSSTDVLTHRLKSFVKNIKHHKYTFSHEKFYKKHHEYISAYLIELEEVRNFVMEIDNNFSK